MYPEAATIIQVDIDGSRLGLHPVNIGLVGDIAPTLDALLPRFAAHEDRSFLEDSLAREAKAEAKLEKPAVAGKGPIHPQCLTETIAKHAAADAVFTADGSSPMVWCLRHVPSTGRNRTVVSLSHGTMANAMPQAQGAQAAYPDRQVISAPFPPAVTATPIKAYPHKRTENRLNLRIVPSRPIKAACAGFVISIGRFATDRSGLGRRALVH